MRHVFASFALIPLAACTIAQSDATAVGPVPGTGTCRNEALAQFVGQPATKALGARMLAATGAQTIRWAPFGTAVTMEYRAGRITVFLDSSNRVERAGCN
jgi:hypothetical protein